VEFFAINDDIKKRPHTLSHARTMDGKFLSDWILQHEFSWGSFIMQAVTQEPIAANFPLRYAPPKSISSGKNIFGR